jgi:hypothetical protein
MHTYKKNLDKPQIDDVSWTGQVTEVIRQPYYPKSEENQIASGRDGTWTIINVGKMLLGSI